MSSMLFTEMLGKQIFLNLIRAKGDNNAFGLLAVL